MSFRKPSTELPLTERPAVNVCMQKTFEEHMKYVDIIEEGEIHWEITSWSEFRKTEKETSSPLTCGGYDWRILVYPNGNNSTSISIYLQLDSPLQSEDQEVCADFVLAIVNPENDQHYVVNYTNHRFSKNSTDWGFTNFHSLIMLTNPTLPLVVHDRLILLAKVRVCQDTTGVLFHSFHDYDSKKVTGYVGLKNQGATCYMNSLLQSLFCTNYFRKAVYQIPKLPPPSSQKKDMNSDTSKSFHASSHDPSVHDKEGTPTTTSSVTYSLQKLFYALQTQSHAVETNELTNSFGWNTVDAFAQHDVQEFLRVLTDNLEEKMKGTPADGMIQSLFVGKMKSYIQCIDVDYESSRVEDFYDIQLNVKGMKNVIESFHDYVQVEKLEGENRYMAEGHGLQDAKKGVLFEKFPPVLHLQLKRFEYDFHQDRMIKINDRYEFPLVLDLDAYLHAPPEAALQDKGPQRFHLHGVLVHTGNVDGGHYCAFLRPTLEEKWFKFDDDRVVPVTLREVCEDNFGGDFGKLPTTKLSRASVNRRFTNAYMLVYIRESDYDRILCPVLEEDVPIDIRSLVEQERMDVLKKEEELREKTTTLKVRVLHDGILNIYPMFFDLCNTQLSKLEWTSRFPRKTTPWKDVIERLAEDWRVSPERLRFWFFYPRHNRTYRPKGKCLTVLDTTDASLTLEELLEKYQFTDLTHELHFFADVNMEECYLFDSEIEKENLHEEGIVPSSESTAATMLVDKEIKPLSSHPSSKIMNWSKDALKATENHLLHPLSTLSNKINASLTNGLQFKKSLEEEPAYTPQHPPQDQHVVAVEGFQPASLSPSYSHAHAIHEKEDSRVLLFVKVFDVEKQLLFYGSHFYVSNQSPLLELEPLICKVLGWPYATPFLFYEEVHRELCEPLDRHRTLIDLDLTTGDILTVQRTDVNVHPLRSMTSQLSVGSLGAGGVPHEAFCLTIPDYYDFLLNRVDVVFKPLHRDQPLQQSPTLALSKKQTYDEICDKLAQQLHISDPLKLRFTGAQPNELPRLQPMKRNPKHTLNEMLSNTYFSPANPHHSLSSLSSMTLHQTPMMGPLTNVTNTTSMTPSPPPSGTPPLYTTLLTNNHASISFPTPTAMLYYEVLDIPITEIDFKRKFVIPVLLPGKFETVEVFVDKDGYMSQLQHLLQEKIIHLSNEKGYSFFSDANPLVLPTTFPSSILCTPFVPVVKKESSLSRGGVEVDPKCVEKKYPKHEEKEKEIVEDRSSSPKLSPPLPHLQKLPVTHTTLSTTSATTPISPSFTSIPSSLPMTQSSIHSSTSTSTTSTSLTLSPPSPSPSPSPLPSSMSNFKHPTLTSTSTSNLTPTSTPTPTPTSPPPPYTPTSYNLYVYGVHQFRPVRLFKGDEPIASVLDYMTLQAQVLETLPLLSSSTTSAITTSSSTSINYFTLLCLHMERPPLNLHGHPFYFHISPYWTGLDIKKHLQMYLNLSRKEVSQLHLILCPLGAVNASQVIPFHETEEFLQVILRSSTSSSSSSSFSSMPSFSQTPKAELELEQEPEPELEPELEPETEPETETETETEMKMETKENHREEEKGKEKEKEKEKEKVMIDLKTFNADMYVLGLVHPIRRSLGQTSSEKGIRIFN
ncbi:hypothetical protein HMI54_000845 [Coelomomyces lativittatus]|nr:hypothetical protein HMI54_000845 [Coelomomyces lativittatus]